MSVIARARQQAEREKLANQGRSHSAAALRPKEAVHEDGKQVWVGEYTGQHEARPHKLSKGDKQPMTLDEQRLFTRTVYERGFTEYHYEGSIRVREGGVSYEDPKDPRRGPRDGHGVLKYPLGESYEGPWRSGKREGKEGTFQTPVNYRYVGDWVDDMPTSRDAFEQTPNGVIYKGPFLAGSPAGNGMLNFSSHNATNYYYAGDFTNGRRHGKGTVVYPNGDTFRGTWAHGMRQGAGITTRTLPGGRVVQYATHWEDDVMVGEPRVLDRNEHVKPPKLIKNTINIATVIPADLTKWTVKDDVDELPLEHFMRIKLGFEKLDENASGSLSIGELSSIWGKGSQAMLKKLDADNSGTVELDEIFAAWYPSVPSYSVQRFLVQDIHPRTLLRFRGILGTRIHDHKQGYLQVAGVQTLEHANDDPPLKINQLEAAHFKIGSDKFTLAMFEAARTLHDPPHFAHVLQVYYPNVPLKTLERCEAPTIADEIDDIEAGFEVLSKGENFLRIDRFAEAENQFRNKLYKHRLQCREAEAAGLPPPEEPGIRLGPDSTLADLCTEGFFASTPFWRIGSINLSVPLLREIDVFDSTVEGMVTLDQILRFCFPNVPCRRSYELLAGRRRNFASGASARCECEICTLGDREKRND